MDSDTKFGTPIVPGSANFSPVAPSPCDAALDEWTFVLDAKGLRAPQPNPRVVHVNSGARITFENQSEVMAQVRYPEAVFGFKGTDIPPRWSDTLQVIRYTVLAMRGTITCSDLGSGSASAVEIIVCPTKIA